MDTDIPEDAIVKHYVCSECGTVSKNAGNCQTDYCIQQGSPLRECHCTDGKHDGIVHVWSEDGDMKDTEKTNDEEDESKPVNTLDLDSDSSL